MAGNQYLDKTGIALLWERMKQYVYECCCGNNSSESASVIVPENSFLKAERVAKGLGNVSVTVAAGTREEVSLESFEVTSGDHQFAFQQIHISSAKNLVLCGFGVEVVNDVVTPYVHVYNPTNADIVVTGTNVYAHILVFGYEPNTPLTYCLLTGTDCENVG